ncbi:MAG: DNA polymerase III subunit alpha, partial [Bacteroidota bacterium]
VIEYVLRRYRKSHTALLATHTCFKGKASIRELGKVFGLPKKEIDRLVFYRHEPEKALDKLSKQVLYYASMLDGMPNHLGIHAGGILVSEQPIYRYTGTNLPPKNFPITHFDMHIAEDIGLHKFDVLSQRGLGHIRECVRIVKDNQGENLDIHATDEFKEDPQVREMLKKGKTMGCFYVESPAMRGLLAKLRCEDYPTLVAASSIIRPGVARSGMMRAYIERHNGRLFHSLHPRLKEILHDTYEVMVYQEDVIKVAHEFAGMDLADADLLRRIMSGKAKGKKQKQFEALKQRFFDCCGEKGYPQDTVSELWRQIESFGGYSFAKGHSASFAVESYQSLYLKTYYPLEFMVAVINNFGGFYDTEIYVHEARMWGANIHLPCVNHSSYHTRIIGKDIYLGFCHLKDLGEKVGQEIERERLLRGDFTDMADFARRLRIAEKDLVILVRIGAFRFSGRSKPHLLWEVKLHLCPADAKQQADVLFDPGGEGFELPVLATDPLEDAYDEMELLGFPMMSPFKLIESYNLDQFVLTKDLRQHVDTIVEMLGYLVCVKTTKTVHGDRMYFANFIDPAGEMFDVTIFPPEAKQIGFPGRGVYRITGKVAKDFTYCSLELVDVAKCVYRVDPRLERV